MMKKTNSHFSLLLALCCISFTGCKMEDATIEGSATIYRDQPTGGVSDADGLAPVEPVEDEAEDADLPRLDNEEEDQDANDEDEIEFGEGSDEEDEEDMPADDVAAEGEGDDEDDERGEDGQDESSDDPDHFYEDDEHVEDGLDEGGAPVEPVEDEDPDSPLDEEHSDACSPSEGDEDSPDLCEAMLWACLESEGSPEAGEAVREPVDANAADAPSDESATCDEEFEACLNELVHECGQDPEGDDSLPREDGPVPSEGEYGPEDDVEPLPGEDVELTPGEEVESVIDEEADPLSEDDLNACDSALEACLEGLNFEQEVDDEAIDQCFADADSCDAGNVVEDTES